MTTGAWVREQSRFRDWITADGSSGYPAEPGRYHLYVSLACPWSHRTVIVRMLKGLEDAISISYAHPYRDERGWAFPGGRFGDALNAFDYLSEAYERTRPGYDGRVSVPVLWDRESGRIVSNESADIVRMLGSAFDGAGASGPDLYPEPLRAEVDAVNELVYENVNNGVYRAGFAGSQEAYDEAFRALFATLDRLEELLARRRCLVGVAPTEADWRLFPTLVRFDTVYHTHFRCNGRRIVDYRSLWAYTRDLYQRPGVAGTVAMDEIKQHYYTTHDSLNPKRIVPAGPLGLDFDEPHRREDVATEEGVPAGDGRARRSS